MKYSLWLLVVLQLSAAQVWAQDMARLRERCNALWAERIAGDRAKASRFVEEKSRKDFMTTYEPTVKSASIAGIEFSDNPNIVMVSVKATLVLPIGEVERTVVEPWVWADRNWFLQLLPAANPFSSAPQAAPTDPEVDVPLEIVDSAIDLGRHTQGEIVKGSVRFKSAKSRILAIRGMAPEALRLTKVNWLDENGGTIDFTVNTTFTSGDIDDRAVFVAVASLARQKAVNVPLRAKIDGRVRFTQTPEVANTTQDGTLEVQIENIWNAPITLNRAVTMHPSMSASFEGPVTLKPGEAAKVTVKHRAQKLPKPASLRLTFADGLFPETVSLSLKTWVTRTVQSNYTRQQLEDIINKQKLKKQQ